MPANGTISLKFATVYELYGGVPAWSHAQLSIVGYSDRWLWEEAWADLGEDNKMNNSLFFADFLRSGATAGLGSL